MFLYVFVKLENRNAWSFDKCVNKLNSITLPFSATFDNSCIGGISNYACAKVAYLHLVKMTFLKSPFLLNKRPLHEKYIITFVFVLSYLPGDIFTCNFENWYSMGEICKKKLQLGFGTSSKT